MSLISELKREVLDANSSVSALLRKALVIARDNNDEANEKWIRNELEGYSINDDVPEYRDFSGRPIVNIHNRGWQYVYTDNLSPNQLKNISSFVFRAPIAEYESNANQDYVHITYDPKAERLLVRAMGGGPMIPAIQFNGAQFQNIVDSVRNKLSEWARQLQERPRKPHNLSCRNQDMHLRASVAYSIETSRGFSKASGPKY